MKNFKKGDLLIDKTVKFEFLVRFLSFADIPKNTFLGISIYEEISRLYLTKNFELYNKPKVKIKLKDFLK